MEQRADVAWLTALHELLDRALDLPPDQRAALLATLEHDQPALAHDVAELLIIEEELDAQGFLNWTFWSRRG